MLLIVRRLVALFALTCATNAFAQTYTYSIYIDADNNAATGCGVSLPGGSVAGAESVLTATVDAGSPPTVTQVTQASCAGGSFGAPTAFGTAAIGVGAGSGGTTAIELGGALASVAPGATTLRLYVVGQSASGSDVLLTTSGAPGGAPILLALNGQGGAVPAPSIGVPSILLLGFGLLLFGSRAARRRLLKRALLGLALVSGIAGAAIFNWNGVAPLASDPAGDETSGEAAIDLRTFFAMLSGGNLQFRIDVSGALAVPPVAAADSYTTPIGTVLTVPAPGVLGNDTLNSATITANINPAHGSLALNADGSFTYTPASGYAGGDSFTYTLGNAGGSSTATVSLVVGSNHAPSFTKGADQTVFEDAAAQGIAGWASAISDGDGDTQTLDFIVTNTNNALFSAQPAVSPAGTLSYTLAANANGTATVSVQLHDNGGTVNGGVDTSAVQTFLITVAAVNDAPSFTKGADENALEDSGAHSVPNWATNLSAGPADESGQALNFLVSNDSPTLFTVPPAIAANGTLSYTLANGQKGTATVSVQIHDDGGTANGGVDTSAVQTFKIVVAPVNHAPSFTKGADQTVLEDAAAQSIANWASAISDNDGNTQALDFIVSNDNNALFATQPAISPAGTLTYALAANANGAALVTVKLHDDGGTANGGVDTSTAQTFTIAVTAVNDAPGFTKGADQTVFENAGAQTVANWATAISPGPADESAQIVSFAVTNNTNPALFSAAPAVAADGTLTYTAAADTSGAATITLVAKDDGGTANSGVDTSAPQTFTITVTAINHAPSFTSSGDQTVDEDAGAQTVTNWATAISDGDGGGQTLAFHVTNNSNAALFSVAPAVSPAGTLTYTSAPDANGTATITLVLQDNGGTAHGGADTSAPQTFTITVDPVDDAPVVTAGAAVGYTEGDPPVLADPTLTVTDIDNATLAGATVQITGNFDAAQDVLAFTPVGSIGGSYAAATGTLTLTGTDTLANYQTALRSVAYVNTSQNPSLGTRTLTWLANDGSLDSTPVTSTVALTAVDNPSTVTAGGTLAYVEGTGPMPIDAGVTVSDPDSPQLAGATVAITAGYVNGEDVLAFVPAGGISATFDPATGALTLSGNATPAAYQTALRAVTYANTSDNPSTVPRTVSWQVNDGELPSNIATSTVTLTAVDNPPVVTAGAAVTYTEGDPAVLADTTLTVTDVDSTMLAGATVQVTGNFDTTQDVLAFTPTATITGSYAAATGTLTLTGADTLTNYQTALRSVTYLNTSQNPSTGTRTLSWSANDGTSTGAADTSTVAIISINSAPSFTKGPDPTVNEDAGAQTVPNWATAISDGDGGGQTLTFQVTNNTNAALFSAAPAVSPTGTLTYTTAPDANGTATITLVLKDNGGTADGGMDTSAPQTFTITVNAVNDSPSFTKGPDQTVLEDAGAQTASPWATAISPGPADESTQTVTFNITANTNPSLFSAGPAVSPTGVLTYTPAANANGTATITLVAKDSGGTANGGVDTSAPQTFSITVTPVNDAPSFVKGPDQDVLDNIGAQTINPWATAISAGPNEAGQTLNFIVGNDNPAAFTAGGQPAVSSAGVLTYTPAVQSTAGFVTANVSVQIHDNGGTANSGVDTSAAQNLVIKITHANIAPTLTNATITYATAGNTQLHVAGATLPGVVSVSDANSILTKSMPTDSDGPVAPSVVPASGASTQGGSYTVNANGSFTFVPKAGFSGTDTFTFQVTDQATPAPGLVTGTVSVTVGQRVWYIRDVVDASNPGGGDGRSTNAFDNIAAFNAATTNTGDIIFVFRGNTGTTALSGGITLKNGQRLWGEGVGLTLPTFGTLVPAGQPPRINASPAIAVSVPATAADATGVEIRGLDLQGAPNAILVNATGAFNVGVLVSNNTISGAAAEGIKATFASTSATQQIAVQNNTVTATGNGIDLNRTAGTAYVTAFDNNAIDGNTGGTGVRINGLVFDATPGGTYQTVSGGTTTIGASGNGVGVAGMVLAGVSGDLSFTDLDIYADAGTGLQVGGTGAFTGSAGFRLAVANNVGTIVAVGGPALDLSTFSANLPFNQIKSSNSASTGVNISSLAGQVSAGSGSTISNAVGTDFSVNAGNADVAYAGTITDATGRLVAVSGTAGGTISFSGAINDTGAGTGTGIALTSNAAGTAMNFTGPLTLSTGANDGFTATGGGTVTASDATSTLTTTTGTAINVANTTIGAAGLKFKSVSSNGGANGIVLNNTGAAGGLIVSGTGTTAGSGGTIQNKSVRGASLKTTSNVSLSNMNFTNNGTNQSAAATCGDALLGTNTNCGAGIDLANASNVAFTGIVVNGGAQIGINGNNVNGLTMSGVTVSNVGNENLEDGVQFVNLYGTVSIQNSSFTGNYHRQFEVQNNNPAGALTMSISNATFDRGTYVSTAAQGVLIAGNGTAQMTTSINGSTFRRNFGTALTAQGIGNAQMTFNIGTTAANTFTDNSLAFQFLTDNAATMDATASNNTITVTGTVTSGATPVTFRKGTNATGLFVGNFTNNTIGAAGTVDSGNNCAGCNGVSVTDEGLSGGMRMTITGNTIQHIRQRGVEVIGQLNDTLGAVVTNNTFASPDGVPATRVGHAIFMQSGTDDTDGSQLCADIQNNNVAGGATWDSITGNMRLRLFPLETGAPVANFRLRNIGGAGTAADAITYLNLTSGNTNAQASATVNGITNFTTGTAVCF